MTFARALLHLRAAALLAVSLSGFPGYAVGTNTPPASADRHWAFQPVNAVAIPSVPGKTLGNPVDAFVLQRLTQAGLHLSPEASRTELIRRVTYDLTGLPPTPDEVDRFAADRSPDAYERLVDRLLASPRFGERWAQHWLDLAHYADSNGFELDADRPDAWRYRDWVIAAFNSDMPYGRFLVLQVAGDEVAPGNHEALIAAGFGRSGPREVVSGNIDPEVRRQDELTAVTSTVGSVFLGVTLGCARCHDHKFDPIPLKDFYRLQAFFAGAEWNEVPIHDEAEKTAFDRETARINALIKPIEERRSKLEAPYRARLAAAKEAALTPAERAVRMKPKEQRTPEEERQVEGIASALRVTWEEIAEAVARNPADHAVREDLKRQVHQLQVQLPSPPAHAMTLVETNAALPATHLLKRGDVKNKGTAVEPMPPGFLLASMKAGKAFSSPSTPISPTHSGRRLALAQWLADASNPLTARVIANRVWQHHFGRGIVATSSDFGTRGAPPTHPELLDWLATELIHNGWHLKALHRLIVTSQTYRQASILTNSPAANRDPENLLLWRMNRRRMEAEGLRDATLSVAGVLNAKSGGPGIRIPLEPEVKDLIFTEAEVVDLWPVEPDPTEHQRRSIYVHRKRNVHYPMFDAFDAPDAQTPCPVRAVSTHAPQALVMINSGFAQGTARAMAAALLRTPGDEVSRIRTAFRRCFAREPEPSEIQMTRQFLGRAQGPEIDRWTDVALALINSNEFVYVP